MPKLEDFDQEIEGKEVKLFYLEHPSGIKAAVTNYGGRLVSLWVKDQAGEWTDVVLGFNSLAPYTSLKERFYGATIGRFGNRIAQGKFTLDGEEYQLSVNNGPNTLHGGLEGFGEQVWTVESASDTTLVMSYLAADGEMGFPGELRSKVTYSLNLDVGLRLDYEAETQAPTVVNLTNHAFFNLNGEGSGSINQHLLMIDAYFFTPVDSTLIPTGELRPVEGTPFDFREPTPIGSRLAVENQQLSFGKGYDHNFVIKPERTFDMHLSARVVGDQSGIVMEVWSQEPGLQFYGGNFMDGSHQGKSGKDYRFRTAFCLETQHFPDSPNQDQFPSTVLRPGEKYQTSSEYRFYTQ
ncbi:MAG: aldose epimerase family protein [Bacteroidota bacterium]